MKQPTLIKVKRKSRAALLAGYVRVSDDEMVEIKQRLSNVAPMTNQLETARLQNWLVKLEEDIWMTLPEQRLPLQVMKSHCLKAIASLALLGDSR